MLLVEYLAWHFMVAPRNIWEIAANYSEAYWHRFLIVQHLGSLFAPWHRRKPSDIGGVRHPSDFIINAVTDFYIRILAAIVRLSIVFLGLIAQVLVFVLTLLVFTGWILWPILCVVLIKQGLSMIYFYVF